MMVEWRMSESQQEQEKFIITQNVDEERVGISRVLTRSYFYEQKCYEERLASGKVSRLILRV